MYKKTLQLLQQERLVTIKLYEPDRLQWDICYSTVEGVSTLKLETLGPAVSPEHAATETLGQA